MLGLGEIYCLGKDEVTIYLTVELIEQCNVFITSGGQLTYLMKFPLQILTARKDSGISLQATEKSKTVWKNTYVSPKPGY